MTRLNIFLLRAAQAAGVFAVARSLTRSAVRILAYHGVDDTDSLTNFDGFHVSQDLFRRQMDELARRYTVVPLANAVAMLRGEQPVGRRVVALTFDDGYRNNATVVAPILREYGFPATFYLFTDFLDRRVTPWWVVVRQAIFEPARDSLIMPDGQVQVLVTPDQRRFCALAWEQALKALSAADRERRRQESFPASAAPAAPWTPLSWDEVRTLQAGGHEIGGHTARHTVLSVEDKPAMEEDIWQGVQRLEQELGCRPRTFSFPYGSRPSPMVASAILRQYGFLSAVGTEEGLNRPVADVFALRRLNVTGHHQPQAFSALVSGFSSAWRAKGGGI